jgi:hypothetical protein
MKYGGSSIVLLPGARYPIELRPLEAGFRTVLISMVQDGSEFLVERIAVGPRDQGDGNFSAAMFGGEGGLRMRLDECADREAVTFVVKNIGRKPGRLEVEIDDGSRPRNDVVVSIS